MKHVEKQNSGLELSIKNLRTRRNDIQRYAEIMDQVGEVDVSVDIAFQKKFTSFYRVRRDDRWRGEFYRLFEECKTVEALSFQYILKEMFHRTGRIEASFSSKLLATLNPQMPIWDRIVLSKLQIKPGTYQNKEKRITETVELYQEIEYWYRGFLQSEGGREYLDTFDDAFPEYKSFSSVKKIDFLLWGSGEVNPLPRKGIEIHGCVEVPMTVSEDDFLNKFIEFIEANHWYFGGGINEMEEE